jgi:sulfate adenylyltransferase large subunit
MIAPAPPAFDIESFLAEEHAKDLLRFTTAGSVDDGKSTLIGRLLYDSRNVYEDQIHAVRKASTNRSAGELDLSLLTDGLRAEREQGITIDVAYRYFATARRKFIIADTPGHEQYTRNMATGASNADLAIILIDARNGVQPQSRRHAFISALLGIRRLVVAVNKMDLVDYSRDVFASIEREFLGVLARLGVTDAWFVPISALAGDNVVTPSRNMTWFTGPSLLEYLETVPVAHEPETAALRMPVQYVIRTGQDFRGYAGQIAAGAVKPGDRVIAWPSGRSTRIKSIETYEGPVDEAAAPMSVTVTVEDDIDISRGDLLASAAAAPEVSRAFAARIVWLHADPLNLSRQYLVKHGAQTVPARVRAIRHRIDIGTLDEEAAAEIAMNEIGAVEIETSRPLLFDPYARSRAMGSAILIDPASHATVGALMIESAIAESHRNASTPVTAAERTTRFGHRAAAMYLGPRLETARILERRLFDHGCNVAVVTEWNAAAVSLAEAAGVLALVVSDHNPGLPAPSELAADDREAAEQAFAWLAEGFLVNSEYCSGGAGI